MTLLASPITRSADHHYTYQGVTYPGVTSILGVAIDKSEVLKTWAANQTADAVLGLITAAEDGSWDFGALDALLRSTGPGGVKRAITDRGSWQMDEARDLGTEVHNLADMVVNAQPTPAMKEGVRKRVLAYADWWKASGWTLRTSEAMIVHPEAKYGGTLDLLARDRDGRTVLADIKTGKGVYREAVLQLTAYGMAPLIQMKGQLYAMPKIDRHVILHVTLDGVREIEVPVGTLEQIAFYACCDLHVWAETTKGKRL